MPKIAVVGAPEEVARRCQAWLAATPALIVPAPEGPADLSGSRVPWPSDADAVYVASSLDRRADIAIAAARAGKHLLVEAPLAPTLAGADRVIAAAREAGVSLIPLAVLRYQPFARGLRETVDAGTLGTLRFGHVTLVHGDSAALAPEKVPDPGSQRPLPRQEAFDALDLLAWLFARPIRSLFARACPIAGPDSVDVFLSVVVTFADGGQAVCDVGRARAVGPGGLARVAVIGEQGSAYHDRRHGDLIVGPSGARPLADDPLVHLTEPLEHWALEPGTWPETVESVQQSLAVVLAAAASLERGEPVALAPAR